MMDNCEHLWVKEIEGSFIPSYEPQGTVPVDGWVRVPQWECVCCKEHFGYLTVEQNIVKGVNRLQMKERGV